MNEQKPLYKQRSFRYFVLICIALFITIFLPHVPIYPILTPEEFVDLPGFAFIEWFAWIVWAVVFGTILLSLLLYDYRAYRRHNAHVNIYKGNDI